MIPTLSNRESNVKEVGIAIPTRYYSLNNGYVEGSFISFLEPVGALPDPKSVVRNLVAPRIL